MTKKEIIERYGIEEYQRRLNKNKEYYQDNKDYFVEYHKQYIESNKEYITEYQKQYNKQYYQDNKKCILKQKKKYYDKNKKNISEYTKQYYEDNKDNILERAKEYRYTPMGKAVQILMDSKRYDNTRFGENTCDLTHEWIIDNIINATHCHYCGCELNYDNLSIDRKNSDLPHTKDNCVASCFNCNRQKKDTPYEEYIAKKGKPANN